VQSTVAVSNAIARELGRYSVAPVTVVPVPVPAPTAVLRRPSECHDVVFAGRLSRDKGAHVLVDAFARAAGDAPDAGLVLAGDGPQRAALEQQVAALPADVRRRITFLGHIGPDAVSAAMGQARVVVVPSLPALRREGSSLTAAEAARHGRPVVGSDDPAVAEVVLACGGTVVPAGDVDALAAALARVLADPAGADESGRTATSAASARYDGVAVATAIREVYADVVRTSARLAGCRA
jgi:glycosyltransferase involved in cell wall biosynthesis